MTKTTARKGRDRQHREYLAHIAQITTDFEGMYGRDETKLEKWQQLCRDVGVTERTSITQCQKELKGIYINVVDFVEAKRTGGRIHIFRTYKALQSYIENDRSKVYPIRAAKQSPILKWMLIHLWRAKSGERRSGQAGIDLQR